MGDITVSIAEFKANLSRMLAESRAFGKTIILLNRKKPVATVVPYTGEGSPLQPGSGGLASLAGAWADLAEIGADIDEAFHSRRNGEYREIPF